MEINPLKNFDLEVNFWDTNTELKLPKPFNSLYKEDKTKSKKNSSQIMWAIALCYDPRSKFSKLTEKNRKELIENDFLKEKIDWGKYQEHIFVYKSLFLTQAERSLQTWERKLEERDEYLNSIPYSSLDIEVAAKFDNLLANTPKLYKQYNDILEQLAEEEAKGNTRGGHPESASEKKLI